MTLSAFRDAGALVKVLVVAALVCVSAASLPRLGNHDAVPLRPSMGEGQALESKVVPVSDVPLVSLTFSTALVPSGPAGRRSELAPPVDGRPALRSILRC